MEDHTSKKHMSLHIYQGQKYLTSLGFKFVINVADSLLIRHCCDSVRTPLSVHILNAWPPVSGNV